MTILIAVGPIASSIQAGFLFADNFNRADQDPLAGDWTTQAGGVALKLLSNAAHATAGTLCSSWVNAVTPNNDQSAQCTMSSVATGQGGPAVRMNTSGNQHLYGMQVYSAGTQAAIYRIDFGGYAAIDTASVLVVDGDTLKVTVQGTTIKGYLNGVEILSGTDATFASGRFGILAVGTPGAFDDFVGNNL